MAVPSRTIPPIALCAMEVLHEGPRHPYEIHQTMRDRQAWRLFKLTTGSLYHAIERLERDGLIAAVETSRAGRRPERTIYQLTDTGRDVFAERVRAMVGEPATEYPQYVMAVSLLHELDPADALTQLRRRALCIEASVAAERVVCDRLAEQGVPELYWSDVDLKVALREAELSWTKRMIDRLERREIAWPDDDMSKDEHQTPRLSVVQEQENTG